MHYNISPINILPVSEKNTSQQFPCLKKFTKNWHPDISYINIGACYVHSLCTIHQTPPLPLTLHNFKAFLFVSEQLNTA